MAAFVSVLVGCLALAGCSGSDKPAEAGGTSASGSSSPSGPPPATVQITPAAGAHPDPLAPIVVKVANGTLQSVQVVNPQEHLSVNGTFSPARTSWSTSQVLGYGKTYAVTAVAKNSAGVSSTTHQTVTVMNPPTAYPSVIPPPDTDIGVGMPLAVRFDKPIQDRAAVQKMLTVTSQPAQAGAWYWLSDSEVDYRPAVYWQAHTKLTLSINVYGKNLGGGIFGDTDRTVGYTVHDSWVAKADGNTHQMDIYHDGVMVKPMPISMGSTENGTPTHIGTHVVSEKYREYTMNSCSYGVCSGPDSYVSKEYYAERISNDGEFVHENPNSVAQQGNTNVSHGCINLDAANAAWFFDHFGVGDVVEVTNSGGPSLPLGDRIGVWSIPWQTWQAGNAA